MVLHKNSDNANTCKQKTPMKLSVVIPLYNKEKYVERCLESLINQDILSNEYEIVIVDDGSKDSGATIVEKFAKKHNNINLIRQENQGPSAARNRGLEASNGKYIYFLDADDYLANNVFGTLLNLGEQNNLEILEFNTKHTTNAEAVDIVSKGPKNPHVQVLDGMTYVSTHGFRNEAWRYFVSKNLLQNADIKFIEGTLYEDAIFTASLFLNTERMAKVNIDVHRYVVVENSIVTSKDRSHNLKFIHGMVNAIEHFHGLIKRLDSSHSCYSKVVNRLKARQQSFVFALIIRTLKYRLLSFKELKEILTKLNKLDVYPINPKVGGIGNRKNRRIFNMTFVPIFNNKTCLYLGLGIMKLIPIR